MIGSRVEAEDLNMLQLLQAEGGRCSCNSQPIQQRFHACTPSRAYLQQALEDGQDGQHLICVKNNSMQAIYHRRLESMGAVFRNTLTYTALAQVSHPALLILNALVGMHTVVLPRLGFKFPISTCKMTAG